MHISYNQIILLSVVAKMTVKKLKQYRLFESYVTDITYVSTKLAD
jgi:hypothetical protein